MISKIGIWLLIKIAEGLASKYMTSKNGEAKRVKLIDFLIKRAAKAKITPTSADNDILAFWVGVLKSDRLKAALGEKNESSPEPAN